MTAAARGGGVLILSRREVRALMAPADWFAAAERAFAAAAVGHGHAPSPMHVDGQGGVFHAKGARLDLDRAYVAVKVNGNFPGNPAERGLPTIQGAILLCDATDGRLLAILDSIEVTLRRTAAASALAARHLARPDSETLLVCGCGEQGAAHVTALRDILQLRRVFAWDRDPARAETFARGVGGIEASVVTDLRDVAVASDVIVTCTTAREPFLSADLVSPGTFVAAVGADNPDKSEIRPDLMAQVRIIADSIEQCAAMGDLHHALSAGAVRREDVDAEFAELVAGSRPGRTDPDDIILFDSTGTALQDVAAAAMIHERALDDPGLRRVALGAV